MGPTNLAPRRTTRRRLLRIAQVALVLFLVVLLASGFRYRKYVNLFIHRRPFARPPVTDLLKDPVTSKAPQLLLDEANRLAELSNWHRALPLYQTAESLFAAKGKKRDESLARAGRIRAQGESGSYVEATRELAGLLDDDPFAREDKTIRLWCLAQKGYMDIFVNTPSSKRDWLEAQEIASSLGDAKWLERAKGELGTIAYLDGDVRRGVAMISDALISAEALGDAGAQIWYLGRVGYGFNDAHRHAEAVHFLDAAIKVSGETSGAPFPYFAYEEKAESESGEGKNDEARSLLEHALEEASAGESSLHEAWILAQLGELFDRTGDRVSAIRFLERAGSLGEQHGLPRVEARAMFKLAGLYRKNGNLRAAESAAAKGLDATRLLADRYPPPSSLTVLADIKAEEGEVAAAETLYEQAESVVDGLLTNAADPYWSTALANAQSETYLRHFILEADSQQPAAALRVLERVRGRTASALLENKPSGSQEESPQVVKYESAISDLQLRLMHSKDPAEHARLMWQLQEAERALDYTHVEEQRTNQLLFEKPAAANDVQKSLHEDDMVLEYVLAEPHSYCVWISRNGTHVATLSEGRTQIEELTRQYLATIRNKSDDINVSKKLYEVLVGAPLHDSKTHHMVVVADGALHLLPFETLRDSSGRLLLETTSISYAPSSTVLSVLRNARKNLVPTKTLLAVGDVPYQNQGGVADKIPKPKGAVERLQRGFSDEFGVTLNDLPQTREEVTTVNKILGGNGVLLLGAQATETAFKSQPVGDFKIIHLAAHGFADTQFPERSGLVLGIDRSSKDDGLLQVREISKLHFNADLVTLSACDGGVGRLQGEAGITNLAEAFLVGGATTVVASLWSADDTFTLELMERFYTHLAMGEGKAESLRQAKLELLGKYGPQTSAYYWATFVLIGDGNSSVPTTR